jgi:hypothetical protein
MSEEMEKVSNSLHDNLVPQLWADRGFLSLKPLSSWTQDLVARINFLQTWIDGGTPNIFWISGTLYYFLFKRFLLPPSFPNGNTLKLCQKTCHSHR